MKINTLTSAFLSMLLLTTIQAEVFKKPKKADASQYESVCKRLIGTMGNYGFFIDKIAVSAWTEGRAKDLKEIEYVDTDLPIESFYKMKREIEYWNETRNSDKDGTYEKNAQYFAKRYEQLSTVFDIKVAFKGLTTLPKEQAKDQSDLKKSFCNFDVSFTPKEKLDIGKIYPNSTKKNVKTIIPAVMELSDKDFNILSNLLGSSLAEQRFLDNETVRYLLEKYYVRENFSEGFEYTNKAWGRAVKISISIDELEEISKNPSVIDLPM